MRSDRNRKSHHTSAPDVLGTYVAEVNRCVEEVSHDANAYLALQSAMFGLTSRRAKAYMDMYTAFTRCESSEEFVEEQSRFYSSAIDDYADCSRQLMAAWSSAMDIEMLYGGHQIANANGHEDSLTPSELKVVPPQGSDGAVGGIDKGHGIRGHKLKKKRVAGVRQPKAHDGHIVRRRAH